MRKLTLKQLLLRSLCLVLFNGNTHDLLAQKPTHKPAMWVANAERQTDWNSFKRNKLTVMSRRAGTPNVPLNSSFYFPNFWNWISYINGNPVLQRPYLHVYLGINDVKNVVLIFAPSRSIAETGDSLFYEFSKSFNVADPNGLIVKAADVQRWRKNFVDAMYLTGQELEDPDNEYPKTGSVPKNLSDTRFLTYCWADILDLLEVRTYFGSPADITDHVRGYVGAYPFTGARRGNRAGRFKNRIVVYFDFLNSKGADVDLATLETFRKLLPSEGSKCWGKQRFTNDNGQLCPTTCD